VLAASWARLGERLPLVGGTAQRGDELGNRLPSCALARDLVRLALLVARRWGEVQDPEVAAPPAGVGAIEPALSVPSGRSAPPVPGRGGIEWPGTGQG
jgi:hypothetical protein